MKVIKSYNLIIISTLVFFILFTGCNNSSELQTNNEINSFAENEITEIVIEKFYGENIVISDKNIISQVIEDLNKIKVSKLTSTEEIDILNNGDRLYLQSTYSVTLQNKSEEIQTAFLLLTEEELMLFDINTLDHDRTISYINSEDEETLNYIKNLYRFVDQ